jgi:hypothetical protein
VLIASYSNQNTEPQFSNYADKCQMSEFECVTKDVNTMEFSQQEIWIYTTIWREQLVHSTRDHSLKIRRPSFRHQYVGGLLLPGEPERSLGTSLFLTRSELAPRVSSRRFWKDLVNEPVVRIVELQIASTRVFSKGKL